MDVLRTPDSCFADLPGYPFEPHYIDVGADGLDPVGCTTSTRVLRTGRSLC